MCHMRTLQTDDNRNLIQVPIFIARYYSLEVYPSSVYRRRCFASRSSLSFRLPLYYSFVFSITFGNSSIFDARMYVTAD